MWLESMPPSIAWNQLQSWTRLEMKTFASGRSANSRSGSGGDGPHVGPDDSASLLARVGRVLHLAGEAGLGRLARHLQALAVEAVLPPVIDAAHARFLDPAEVERGEPVRTELADEPRPPGSTSLDCTTGIQYRRIRAPMAVPGPVFVRRSFSSWLSIGSSPLSSVSRQWQEPSTRLASPATNGLVG